MEIERSQSNQQSKMDIERSQSNQQSKMDIERSQSNQQSKMDIERSQSNQQSKMDIELSQPNQLSGTNALSRKPSAMEIEEPLIENRYEKVQFISWEVHTGPYEEGNGRGAYTGLYNPASDKRTDALGQCKDIDARVAFTKKALELARERSDTDATTLKVFMAPEFLYRGAGGAYLHDLLEGWVTAPAEFGLPLPYSGGWDGLFGQLRKLVASPEYEHWIVVFGTAVSASFPTKASPQGGRLLNVADVAQVYNSALIQRGGVAAKGAACHITRKHFKSDIDFFDWYGNTQHGTNVEHLDSPAKRLIETGMNEGSALFEFDAVRNRKGTRLKFGIEICLDHRVSSQSSRFGRLRTANERVNIQLVPSAGMSLQHESVFLLPTSEAPHSYAFNCDGLNNTQPAGRGSHTQIARSDNGLAVQPVINADGGKDCQGSKVYKMPGELPVGDQVVQAESLWSNFRLVRGAGSVRVVDACLI
ncbi:hypothetical protein MJ904_01440 [Massilia sp. MB5]|uniref:hypothetical protein n=1 Tax=Massilia sp. MB5 TaxID=2919578 RepID=UPI001F0D117E|nr:hypothetical protein [Massilia sp. MB5]UMR30962.1 hypothetical protein MJ904_01440 [Massilia sp. MB5]